MRATNEKLLAHIAKCPLRYQFGQIVHHKNVTKPEILAWFQRLSELNVELSFPDLTLKEASEKYKNEHNKNRIRRTL